MVTNLRAPSPSLTICCASDASTSVSASSKPLAEGVILEAPLANTATVSLVEVSPSTEMRLKLRSMACFSATRSVAGGTTASVITNASVVAMRG